ncbi:class E sortase [Nocardioides sp. BP30]|uniref:class E sortase n=1 Tax=Nocardioides sp. BP30 TaxID=3036374 RepID=UPI00246982C0|nr:class E sortase [Nocardioides sp. BP30]WGL51813.1 class E sortase [Nocardioides sp. BP30]
MGRRRRLLLWPGLALVAAGLALLGYVAWEFWGTTWVSHRHRDQAVGALRQAWHDGDGSVRTRWGDADAIIRIPRFGASYAVPVLEGTSDAVLATGFGHFSGAVGPGQVGNYALAAHRITHGEPLRRMPDLRVGDRVIVQTRAATYTYRLTSAGDALVVPFTSTWVTAALPTNPEGGVEPAQRAGQRLLTLTTCSELFHTDNRMVAFGVLASVS